jgi:hypothetical protein
MGAATATGGTESGYTLSISPMSALALSNALDYLGSPNTPSMRP